MISIRFFYLVCLCFFVSSVRAEMADVEYEQIVSSFEKAAKSINELSSSQLLKLADMADRISTAAIRLEKDQYAQEAALIPEHANVVFTNNSNNKVIVHSPAENLVKTQAVKRKSEIPKLDLPTNTQQTEAETARNDIYVHVVFGNDYYENYIDHEDRINAGEVLAELKREHPKARAKTLQRYLLLHVEKKFRSLLLKNPDLTEVTKYVGLCESDKHRVLGHVANVKNTLKVEGSMKAKYLKAVLDSGYNVRMNTLVYNLPKKDLAIFEALIADIFSVQINGCSARISDSNSIKIWTDYKKWHERKKALRAEKIDDVVDDQVKNSIQRSLPRLAAQKRELSETKKPKESATKKAKLGDSNQSGTK